MFIDKSIESKEITKTIDATNKYQVSARGRVISIMLPVHGLVSANDAMLLAAWLVSIAESQASAKFAEVLEAVHNT